MSIVHQLNLRDKHYSFSASIAILKSYYFIFFSLPIMSSKLPLTSISNQWLDICTNATIKPQ